MLRQRLFASVAALSLLIAPVPAPAWPVHKQAAAGSACGSTPAPAAAAGFTVCNFAQNNFSSANVDTTGANPAGATLRCGMWFGAACANEASFSSGKMILVGNATTAASNVVSANAIPGCSGALAACFHGMAFQNGGYFCATIQLQNNLTSNAFWGAWWSFSLNHILQSIPSQPDVWVGTNGSFTASISANVMTVTAVASGHPTVGTLIATGAGVTASTAIDGNATQGTTTCGGSACTGTGGTGTYHVNKSQTVGSEAMTSNFMQWFTEPDFWEYNTQGTLVTASASGTTLTTSVSCGSCVNGANVADANNQIPAGVTITGGSGTSWTLSANVGTVASEQMAINGFPYDLVNNLHVHWGDNNFVSGYNDISTFDAINIGQSTFTSAHEYCELIIPATASVAGKAVLYLDGTLINVAGNNVWGPPTGVNNGTVLPPPSGTGTYAVADFQPLVLSIGGTDYNNWTVTSIRVFQAHAGDMLVN